MDTSWLFEAFRNFYFIKLIQITVFLLMFTVALRLPLTLQSPLLKPSLLGRTLLSVNVLVPVALLVILLVLGPIEIPVNTQIALIILAAAPGAPLLTVRAMKAGGDFLYAADLQVAVSLMATLTAPLTLWLFARLLPSIPAEAVQPLAVLKIVVLVQLLPIALGMAVRAFRAEWADWLVGYVANVSRVLFLGLLIVLLIIGAPTLVGGGIGGAVAILLFSLACLGIGHLLGGPGLRFRSTLAIGSLARNIGLALLIARVNNAVVDLLPTIIAFLLIGAITGIVYSKGMTKYIAQVESSVSEQIVNN
jgi:BASS family bile acid:Na+ symporter